MNITPRGDRVLVEIDYKPEQIRASGLVIPEATKATPQRGKVLAVGEGRRTDQGDLIPVGLAEGDIVIYNQHAGTKVEPDDDHAADAPKLALFRELDILAVVTA